jgi:hypothetical protein
MVEESKTESELTLINEDEEFKASSSVALNDISKLHPEMIRGDKDLFNSTKESEYPQDQINYWISILTQANPSMDCDMIKQIVETYSKHPQIVSDICNEHRADNNAFIHHNKEDPMQGVSIIE